MAGEADTPTNIPGGNIPGGVIPDAVKKAKETAEREAAASRASKRPVPLAMRRPQPSLAESVAPGADGLSIPFRLHSAGIYYQDKFPGYDGNIVISPTRGEQEEILAGALDKPEVQLAILRHVTSQCFNTRGLPYNELLLHDWLAAMLHFLALSTGSDVVNLEAVHTPGCGAKNDFSRALTELPHTVLRLAEPGEEPPPPEDPMAAVFREVEAEGEDGAEANPETVRLITSDMAKEPFTSKPLPITGEIISWRHHRVYDLIKAEELASRMGDTNVAPGGRMFTLLLARQIVAINGKPVSPLEAVGWVRRSMTPVLNALRAEMKDNEFGYKTSPTFRCKTCGQKQEMKVTLDANLFRPPARA